MTITHDLKRQHLAAADSRWERAVEQYRETLAHYLPGVGVLARRLLTVRSMTRFYAFCGFEREYGLDFHSFGTQIPYDPCALLEFTSRFAGYLIGKHSEPGVGYYRHALEEDDNPSESYVLCDKGHPRAMPYFHSSWELMCQDNPSAERATPERALAVLDWYEERDRQNKAEMLTDIEREGEDCLWDAYDVTSKDPDDKDKQMAALAEALDAKVDG